MWRNSGVSYRCGFIGAYGFLQCEGEVSRKRHLESVLRTLRDPKFLQKLAGGMTKSVSGEYSLTPTKLSSKQVADTLEKFEHFLLSTEFTKWFAAVSVGHDQRIKDCVSSRAFEDYFSASTFYDVDQIAELTIPVVRPEPPSNNGLKDYAEAYGLALEHISGLDLASIGAVFLALRKEKHYRSAGLKEPISLVKTFKSRPGVEVKEFVLTGAPVWQEEGRFEAPKIGQPFSEEGVFRIPSDHPHQILSPQLERHGRLDSLSLRKGANWNLDYWTTFRVELFLNQDCNYSLVIELGSDHGPRVVGDLHFALRTVVIRKISGRHVLDHLNELRGWLGMAELPEHSIKEEIARSGGYIPGAEIL